MGNHHPWNKGLKYEHNPAPMEIPKGYTSPFVEGEMALNELWMGEGKFLRQFERKQQPKGFMALRGVGNSDFEFNPNNVKEGPSEDEEPVGDQGGVTPEA